MQPLNPELDLAKIARQAERCEDENLAFRSFLKGRDPQKTDEKVHRLNEEISARIDCTTCGNCCKAFMISLDKKDIARAADHLQLSQTEFKDKYVEESQQGLCIFNHIPCRLLYENKCTIYEARPDDCRSFPHLHLPGFTGRLLSVLDNYGVCPIVYNVLEALKEETGFRYNTGK